MIHNYLFSAPRLGLLAGVLLLQLSCAKEDGRCIEDLSVRIEGKAGQVSFLLPDGSVRSGTGTLPMPFTIGDHAGTLQSVIVNRRRLGSGEEAAMIHFFSDWNGNAFWTNDKAVLFPLDRTGDRLKLMNVFQVAGGTGVFACAKGHFTHDGRMDLRTGRISGILNGRICGSCD